MRARQPAAVLVCAVASLVTFTWTAAQTPPARPMPQVPIPASQPQSPVFTTRVDLIQIDVTVLDRNRRPVRGLTAKDFTIFEDGKPQQISAVVEMSASDPEAPAGSWLRTVTPDVKVNNAEDGRVLLIILDDARTSPLPRQGTSDTGPKPIDAAKQIARAIVDRMGPADLASVIFTVKNKSEQEFTSDRNRLFAAIDAYVPGIDHEVGFNTMRAYDTYRDAAKFLSTVPNRRKAIILISAFAPPVLPLDVPATAIVGQPMPSPGRIDLAASGGVAPRYNDTPQADLVKMEGMKQLVLEDALRGNVAFYNVNPISMPGLDAEVSRMLEPDTSTDSRPATSFSAPTSGPPPTPKYYADVRSTGLDQLTGGFSIRRPEEFAAGITQIFRETGSYYLLGYTNPEAKDNGKFRKIEVKVNREDLVVRARTGYVAPKKNDATKYVSPMWNAISGLLPATDIPMRAHVSTFAIPGKEEVAVAIAVGLREPLPPDATKSIPETVQFLTLAFTPKGDKRGSPQVTTAELLLHPNDRGESKYEVLSLLKLKPGQYHLRMSATSKVQRKSGSIYYDVDVPDYAKAPLSLSSIVISATPALVAGPRELIAQILPVVPTTQREFQRHRGQAFMRIYQGGAAPLAPAEMTIRMVNADGALMISQTEPLPVVRFDKNRAAEFRFDLPVSALLPGDYLISFQALMPGASSMQQDVRFSVSK